MRGPYERGQNQPAWVLHVDGPREVDHVAQYGKSEAEPRLLAKIG